MPDSYDFNATYGKLKVYDQVVDGPCWSFANALAIAAAVKMHTGHEPTWPDDGNSYPRFNWIGYEQNWDNPHFETTIEGQLHTLKKEDSLWNYGDPEALKAHLDAAGFMVINTFIPRSLSDAKSFGINLPIVRGFVDDEKSNVTHAFLIVGYTKDGLIAQNQWGIVWGNEGRVILSWAWLSKWTTAMERLYIDSYPLLGATKPPKPPTWENEDMKLLAKRTATSSAVWAFDPGFRSWVYTREVLPAMGLSMDDVKIIPGTHPIWKLPTVGNKPPVDD